MEKLLVSLDMLALQKSNESTTVTQFDRRECCATRLAALRMPVAAVDQKFEKRGVY
jgi:hypothetical protein